MSGKVFILGSGFSSSFGLPTLNNLFEGIMNAPQRAGEKDKENIYEALNLLYPDFSNLAHTFPNFEEFLSLVNASKDIFKSFKWENTKISALRLLTDYIGNNTINININKSGYNLALINIFLEQLNYGDCIITFNWDNIIEYFLNKMKKDINFIEHNEKSISIFKLHGSINWFQKPKSISFADPKYIDFVFKLSENDEIYCTKNFSYYNNWDVLNTPPYIIPPIISKNPMDESFLGQIWKQALKVLWEAKEIYIIGYSIPSNDIHARLLLRSGLAVSSGTEKKQYSLLDPNPEIGGKYFTLISRNLKFIQAKFSQQSLLKLFGSIELFK